VAEAARNLACAGARPLGITDCLNFGSPENPAIMWQFKECVEGMAEACRVLNVPVVSGNVSFYNETSGQAIHPTPTVAMVGILDKPETAVGAYFRSEGDAIYLLGSARGTALGGSEYLFQIFGRCEGNPPPLVWAEELAVQDFCRTAVERGLVRSAHDCSEGGIAVCLAECGFAGEGMLLGADVNLPPSGSVAETLFGEAASRVVVSVSPSLCSEFERLAGKNHAPVTRIGRVQKSALCITIDGKEALNAAMDSLYRLWMEGFEKALFKR
jgi:phosphoribosylformylglycinamidine synthase